MFHRIWLRCYWMFYGIWFRCSGLYYTCYRFYHKLVDQISKWPTRIQGFFHRLRTRAVKYFQRKYAEWAGKLRSRLPVDQLGILLSRIRGILKTRHTDLDDKPRLIHEIYPNPVACHFHVSERLTNVDRLSFLSLDAQLSKQTPLVKALLAQRGVSSVVLIPYEITIRRGEVFSWEELFPWIDAIILEHLADASVTGS